ncbi:MAG: hypothetical protein HRT47_14025 [Candidatus Caenarcaniphilales bacterium]|nr:hypothetical protein [Candidatus Caenarcaniphilales bacterium]
MGAVFLGGAAMASLGYNIVTNIRKNQQKEQPQLTHGRAANVVNNPEKSRGIMSNMLKA